VTTPREAPDVRCEPDQLRSLFLFAHLTPEQLGWLCERGHIEQVQPGYLTREGDPAENFYVLMDGEVGISRLVGGDEVEINRTAQRGVYGGAFSAYLGDRISQTYNNSLRAYVPSTFFVLKAEDFADFMRDNFPMAVHLLEGIFFGNRNAAQTVGQRERLLALGSLSAGLTHELNNPAAAAVRATSSLRLRIAGMRQKLGVIADGNYQPGELSTLMRLQSEAVEKVAKAKDMTSLEAADREDELSDWFDQHEVRRGYEMAATFAQAGVEVGWLDQLAATVRDGMLETAVRWLNYSLETELLMTEIEDSTERISKLVGAARQYSQLDRAPFQTVDVHELLDSTLVMMSAKLGHGVHVVKNYDRSMPLLHVYAAELNQVWTNLIDNAVQAMDGEGTLTIRTSHGDGQAFVEIGDTGSGIPEDVQPRIFEPFFTTKPVGEGTGLGLDISWRIVVNKHHGDLSVTSQPGSTVFRVCLPLDLAPETADTVGTAEA
jgi:signal transduction histidine kinase